MSILQGELAAELTAALEAADVPYDVAVTRTVITGGDPRDPSTGTQETTSYPCRGWQDEWTQDELANSLVQVGDIKVIVLVDTLGITPKTADKVTVDGQTYAIGNVMTDPAGATWTLQARR